MLRPARLEYLAEDKGKNKQHEQRAEKYPQHAKHGAPVTQQHIALDELAQQVAVLPHVCPDAQGVEYDGAHGCVAVTAAILMWLGLTTSIISIKCNFDSCAGEYSFERCWA